MLRGLALTFSLNSLLKDGPVIMGIVNVTPDSFSDGGLFDSVEAAVQQVSQFVQDGAQIVDIGGESSRPGAAPVGVEEELRRVVPVIEKVREAFPELCISIDTYKPEVMYAACEAGANIINDIYALRQPGALEAAARLEVPVCLMHMKGTPQTMQVAPEYGGDASAFLSDTSENESLPEVVREVREFLCSRILSCRDYGIQDDKIILDPGFGFGKLLEHNLSLLSFLDVFAQLDFPILMGVSRKSMIGQLINKPLSERLIGGIAMACYGLSHGAMIVRTHDVAQSVDAVKVWKALADAKQLTQSV